MSIDTQRLVAFLNTATHPETNPNEAVQAARMAGRMVAAAGLSFDRMRFRNTINLDAPIPTYEPASDIKAARERAERERDAALAKLAAFENQYAELQEENDTLKDHIKLRPNPDGSMEWRRFYIRLVAINYETKGARTAFAAHMKIAAGDIDRWQEKGTVPPEAVAALRTFKPKDTERRDWTVDQDILCGKMFAQNIDVSEISARMSVILGIRVNDGSVKKARQRAKSRETIIAQYEAGVRDPDQITKHLHDTLPANTGGARRSYVDKVLEHQYGIISPEEKARRASRQVSTTTSPRPSKSPRRPQSRTAESA